MSGASSIDENTYWPRVRIPGVYPRSGYRRFTWGLTLILGLSALALRQGPPWRVWLSVILVVSLLGSLGKYTSPIWAARVVVAARSRRARRLARRALGRLTSPTTVPIREDGFLARRRRRHLLVGLSRSAGLPAVPVSRQALHVHVLAPGRPGRDWDGTGLARAVPRDASVLLASSRR